MSKYTETSILDRMYDESVELDRKIEKLEDFIDEENDVYNNLSDEHKELLVEQLYAMQTYSSIVNDRIELMKNEQF